MDSRKQMMVNLAEMERIPRGELIVAANEATCLHILPEVFAEFKKRYAGVAVNVRRTERVKTLESIIDNSVDFGVVSLPVNDSRMTLIPVHRDELVVIVPPQHPLAKMKSVNLADVVNYPLLLPKAGRTRDVLENLCELLKRFVAADIGVGFIPRSNILEDVKAGVMDFLPIANAQIKRDLALVYRKDKALSRSALAFIDIAVELKTAAQFPATIQHKLRKHSH